MCGIAGVLGLEKGVAYSVARALAGSLVHRGPDDEGIAEVPNAGGFGQSLFLVHRRLSIIDLSPSGHQPMRDLASNDLVAFNGEIYNYRSVRERLSAAGEHFESQSDTEVLLKGCVRQGLSILNDLRGMYAFAWWDQSASRLTLAVDPAGIKPLYYYSGPNREFLFASELRALLATGRVPRKVDPVGLEGYLGFGAVQGPHTIVVGVRCLLPGTAIEISKDGKISNPRPYGTSQPLRPELEDRERAITEVKHIFSEVVQDHLVSDVPVGVFLSGGIDSGVLAATAAGFLRDLQTFSVIFKEQTFSEALHSREIAKRIGSIHHELCVSENEFLADLPSALSAMDQPSIDGINVYFLSRFVHRAGLKVALSGQGGDELFAGYDSFRTVSRAFRWRRRLDLLPRPMRVLPAAFWNFVHRGRVMPDKIGQFFDEDGGPAAFYYLSRQLFPLKTRRRLTPGGGVRTRYAVPEEVVVALEQTCAPMDVVNQVSVLELRTYLANMLLRDGDVMSMAHGLEVRVPFLDQRLVGFMLGVSGKLKIERGLPKPLLLKAFPGLIPESIYRRPKQGFTFPWSVWLKGRLRGMAERALGDVETFSRLGIQPETVTELWHAFLTDRGVSWSRIWALIVFREWVMRHEMAL